MKTKKKIYTLGTSNRSLQDFFAILKAFGIEGIVDVRRFPKSNRFLHFTRKDLEESAKANNFSYHWLGDLLGGFRKGGYEAYKRGPSYLKGLGEIENLAGAFPVVLICAERLPWKCHRFKISQSLVERGWNVIHIIGQDHTWQQHIK